ncbi:Fe-S cluster assembly ATPase SufC [candidate division WWE3 bacterium CG08_land_8_20_14_0_20_40_13]|uniref:Fe-S cluster assembly ATPase SufC n=1 Tax=candidate division WWE3 bacterium CG08_land_8_20_14_0_20_40_13 TaxID=1975084 RepID=A0A2H0XE62_UNCKA|nr:MAG: Fe-S cluster assembly ATPase SufC [candidate division WWE3 bacterium CG08_land_8_20_14_0_20_40_13]
MLEIKNLFCSINNKEILKGVDFTINPGETHIIMGPNGSGKSTLASALSGKPGVILTSGSISIDGVDITKENPTKRANLGLFLAFQYPMEIPGVSLSNALRLAYNNKTYPTDQKLSPVKFRKYLKEKAEILGISDSFLERNLNEGASGGEKKKSEILQMLVLSPKYVILDEVDSGLDVDALKKVFGAIRDIGDVGDIGIVVITHYQRILKYITPDFVHIMVEGKIVKSGGSDLVQQIEEGGYQKIDVRE